MRHVEGRAKEIKEGRGTNERGARKAAEWRWGVCQWPEGYVAALSCFML